MIVTGKADWLVSNHDELVQELIRMREERRAAREAEAAE